MTDPFERRLQEEMHRSTERLSLPPAPEVRRRVRLRQAFTVLAAAVALGAIGVAGAATFDALGNNSKTNLGPAGGDEETPDAQISGERGSGGTYPCQPTEFVETCIAEGTYEDVSWAIGVQMDDSLCMTQQTESLAQGGVASGGGVGGSSAVGGRNGCMTYRPDRLELSDIGTNDPDGYFASGYAGANIASATVETESGEVIDLQLYPAPSGHPIEGVQFFAVFLPSDATEIVGWDATGNELDSEPTDQGSAVEVPGNEEEQEDFANRYREGFVEVDHGEIAGSTWMLEARLGTFDGVTGEISGDELCAFLTIQDRGGGGTCSHDVPRDHALNYSRIDLMDEPRITMVMGTISTEVDHVFVEFDGLSREQGYIVDAPEELETDIRIFTVFIESDDMVGRSGTIRAFDAEGVELDPLFAICVPSGDQDVQVCDPRDQISTQ